LSAARSTATESARTKTSGSSQSYPKRLIVASSSVVEALPNIAAVQQMVHDPNGVIIKRLGERPHGEDLARIRDAPVVRNGHAEPHD